MMTRRLLSRLRLPAMATLLALLAASPAPAEEHWHDLHEAVRSGRIVPLPDILDWLEARYVSQVMEVELERDDGRRVYEVEMLGPQGQVVEFEFDAASGELISKEGVNIDGMRGWRGMKVLLVEEDWALAEALSEALGDAGVLLDCHQRR